MAKGQESAPANLETHQGASKPSESIHVRTPPTTDKRTPFPQNTNIELACDGVNQLFLEKQQAVAERDHDRKPEHMEAYGGEALETQAKECKTYKVTSWTPARPRLHYEARTDRGKAREFPLRWPSGSLRKSTAMNTNGTLRTANDTIHIRMVAATQTAYTIMHFRLRSARNLKREESWVLLQLAFIFPPSRPAYLSRTPLINDGPAMIPLEGQCGRQSSALWDSRPMGIFSLTYLARRYLLTISANLPGTDPWGAVCRSVRTYS